MRVLVACEYSGTVRDAFTRQGHYAVSNDILPTESPGEHIQGDALDAIKAFKPDLLIAHPPCTYISAGGFMHFFSVPCRWKNTLEALKFFYQILNSSPKLICVENPRPYYACHLPTATQWIQPSYFGDPYAKPTHLWLKNLPPLMATVIHPNPVSFMKTHDKYKGDKRRKNNSKFFTGIADAMATQWSNL